MNRTFRTLTGRFCHSGHRRRNNRKNICFKLDRPIWNSRNDRSRTSVWLINIQRNLHNYRLSMYSVHTTPYHPYAIGMVERWHGLLKAGASTWRIFRLQPILPPERGEESESRITIYKFTRGGILCGSTLSYLLLLHHQHQYLCHYIFNISQ